MYIIMRGFLFFTAALFAAFNAIQAAPLGDDTVKLDSTVVYASRAGKGTPVAHGTLYSSELRQASPQSSLPMMLGMQPSAVATTEGGTGLGYSKISIRGVSGNQTNVTLNGITLNDAESQEVFWVNIPAIGSYLGSVQVQRGLGTSSNGPGAFGAGINMVTNDLPAKASAGLETGYGSFNTFTQSVNVSFPRGKGGFFASAAINSQSGDGYVSHGKANVFSCYSSLGWTDADNLLRFTFLHGQQRTGITWNGIPLSDWEAGKYRANHAGEYYDDEGELRYYEGQTDNYRQTHFQLSFTHSFNALLTWNATANLTKGYGWYEQYMQAYSPEGDAVTKDYLDNVYKVLRSSLILGGTSIRAEAGIYASLYDGDHFGTASTASGHVYSNEALKREIDAWARAEWSPSGRLNLYTDLQFRKLRHTMKGPDEYGQMLDIDDGHSFFNPRAGLSFSEGNGHKSYASLALGHREPSRTDLQAGTGTKSEEMLDLELGHSFESPRFSASVNLYCMEYRNMLIETGLVNSQGYTVKENTPRAWRRGAELSIGSRPAKWLELSGNLTLSTNKIKEYTAHIDRYDSEWNYLGQIDEIHADSDIILSPSVIGGFSASADLWKGGKIRAGGKYVGSQYWDNTSSEERKVPAYFTADASLSHSFPVLDGTLKAGLYVSNIFNNRYYAYAWVWRAVVGEENYQQEGLFPQAPLSAMLRLSYSF